MKKKIVLSKLRLDKERIVSLSPIQAGLINGGKEAPKTVKITQRETCQSRDAGCTVGDTGN